MFQLAFLLLFLFTSTLPAHAQEVGIEFAQMPVGTTLVTESLDTPKRILEQKFVGEENGFFVMEERQSKNGEPMKDIGKVFYDKAGRRVKSERKPGVTYHKPYSCLFAVGECTHEQDYPNPFTKKAEKRTRSSQAYANRLEGKTLIVTWKLASGKQQEVPFTLGPYNLRVASSYKNALGQQRGHILKEIITP